MHTADPAQLKPPLESVAAFKCNPDALAARLSATDVDQLSAPGPAKIGAIELSNRTKVAVIIHRDGGFAELLAPLSTDIERTLVESLEVLDVPSSSIQWIREGIDKAAVLVALRRRQVDTEKLAFRVELAPQFATTAAETLLTTPESQALMLLVLRISRQPDLAAAIGDTGIKMVRTERTILTDGDEIAPLAIFYQVRDDERTVVILDVQRMGSSDIFIAQGNFVDVAMREATGDSHQIRVVPEVAPVLPHRPRSVASTVSEATEIARRAS